MFENLIVQQQNGVWDVTINRPKVLNALNGAVIQELTAVVNQATDQQARVMILRGAGEKAFVAGADIAAMQSLTIQQAYAFAQRGQKLTTALEDAPFVTIAVVQGFALGGGCELAMACDLIIASSQAKFGQPEVDLGLVAGFGGTQRLVKRVGPAIAMDMLCAGRKITGEEAFQLGLVSHVTPTDKLEEAVQKTVQGILKAGPYAVRESKRLVNNALNMPLKEGLAAEASTFASCFGSPEAKEGLSAFLEKRSARFSW